MSAHRPPVLLPPRPQHCRDTTENGFHLCVHQSSPLLQSPVLATVGLQLVPSWIQSWGKRALFGNTCRGASPCTQSPGDGCLHFRFLESLGLFGTWKVTPHLHEKGWREGLALAVGRVMAPSHPWALTERRSITRTSPYLGSGSEGGWGSQWSGHWVVEFPRNSWQGQGGRPSLTAGRP